MQTLVCAAIRLVQNALTSAFVIVVLTGLDVYLESYDTIAGVIPLLPEGHAAAWVVTVGSLLVWAVFASAAQVWVYRRGLHAWPRPGRSRRCTSSRRRPSRTRSGRGGSTRGRWRSRRRSPSGCWCRASRGRCSAAVAAWLARRRAGLAAATGPSSPSGWGSRSCSGRCPLRRAARRAGHRGLAPAGVRATLLVLVATWLRAAAGTAGLREVSRRVLGRLRRAPAAAEAVLVMGELGSGRELGAAARSVLAALRSVPAKTVPVVDAVLGWVAFESRRFRPAAVEEHRTCACGRSTSRWWRWPPLRWPCSLA